MRNAARHLWHRKATRSPADQPRRNHGDSSLTENLSLQKSNQVAALLRLRHVELHVVARDQRVRIGKPLLQRRSRSTPSAPSSVPANNRTQPPCRQFCRRRRAAAAPRDPAPSRGIPYTVSRRYLCPRIASASINRLPGRIGYAQRGVPARPLGQRLDIRIRDESLPVHDAILHRRHRAGLSLTHNLCLEHLLLFRGVFLPQREVHCTPGLHDIPLQQPRRRRKPSIQRSPRLRQSGSRRTSSSDRAHRLEARGACSMLVGGAHLAHTNPRRRKDACGPAAARRATSPTRPHRR